MFKKIETDSAIVVDNGVYKTAKVYEYNGALFVGVSGGYVRVDVRGGTTHPTVKVHRLLREGPLWSDRFGRLCILPSNGRKPVFLCEGDSTVPLQLTVECPEQTGS